MHKQPQISVIIPIYNAEKYLQRCIDSILSQSFSNFELILVDDGSTDASGKICDEYAAKDKRIHVIHKENGGVSSARNMGLDNAEGEWIYFVDADDEVLPNALEALISGIREDADIVMAGLEKVSEQGDILYQLSCQEGYLDKNDGILINYGASEKCPGNWGWLFVRFFRNRVITQYHIRFDKDVIYNEDELFMIRYICLGNGRTHCIPNIAYQYYESATSVMESTKQRFNPAILTSFQSLVRMKQIIDKDETISNRVKQVACKGVVDRYYMIKKNMTIHHATDKKVLREFSKVMHEECNWHFVVEYKMKRLFRRTINFVCRKLKLNYEISQ